jgi:hypothetical protein
MPGLRLDQVSFDRSFDPVRIGDLDFAREFTAHFDHGYELDIEIIDGAPVCVAIRNPAGITPLHGLREDLGNLDELVKRAAMLAQNEPGGKQLRPLRRSDLRRARQAIKRRRYDDDYHRRVLDLADEAKALGERQDFWVQDKLGLPSPATARTHIRRARDALGEG